MREESADFRPQRNLTDFAVNDERSLAVRLRAMEELDGPPPCQSLHEAVVALDKPAVAWFLQRKGDSVMQHDDDMRTPLLLAAAAGDCTTCTLLIRRMAAYDADSINWPDASGLTPLHWACTQQRVDAVALLLQHAAVRSSTPTPLLLPLPLLPSRPCSYSCASFCRR